MVTSREWKLLRMGGKEEFQEENGTGWKISMRYRRVGMVEGVHSNYRNPVVHSFTSLHLHAHYTLTGPQSTRKQQQQPHHRYHHLPILTAQLLSTQAKLIFFALSSKVSF